MEEDPVDVSLALSWELGGLLEHLRVDIWAGTEPVSRIHHVRRLGFRFWICPPKQNVS